MSTTTKIIMALLLSATLVTAYIYVVPDDTEGGTFCGARGCVKLGDAIGRDGEYISFNGKWRNKWPDTTTQYMIQTGSQTQTNIPAAVTELTGNYRVIADLSEKDEVRFGLTLAVQGSANSKAYVQYTIGGASWFNISNNDSTISLAGTTPLSRVTSWEDLPLGVKVGDATLRVVTVGGDGVADPQYRGVWVETK